MANDLEEMDEKYLMRIERLDVWDEDIRKNHEKKDGWTTQKI